MNWICIIVVSNRAAPKDTIYCVWQIHRQNEHHELMNVHFHDIWKSYNATTPATMDTNYKYVRNEMIKQQHQKT